MVDMPAGVHRALSCPAGDPCPGTGCPACCPKYDPCGEASCNNCTKPLCEAWGGCTLPAGHNRGQADVPSNHQLPPGDYLVREPEFKALYRQWLVAKGPNKTADPDCSACKGTGEVTVPDGPESATTEYCHCCWRNTDMGNPTDDEIRRALGERPIASTIHEALQRVINDAPSPDEARQQIVDIVIAGLEGLSKLTGPPAKPALFYLGSDDRVYRLDADDVHFTDAREAYLADGLIVHARSIVQRAANRLTPPWEPSRKQALKRPREEFDAAAAGYTLSEWKAMKPKGSGYIWAMVLDKGGSRGEIYWGYLNPEGGFEYPNPANEGEDTRTTRRWRGPEVGRVFARLLDGPDGAVVEGEVGVGARLYYAQGKNRFSTSQFEIVADNRHEI